MSKKTAATPKSPTVPGRQRLVAAAIDLFLQQGYAATTIDEICAVGGLTKGGFFHYFANKEAIARAALQAWGDYGESLYAEAWGNTGVDPLRQVHAMLEIMAGFTRRKDQVCTCVVGILSQELALSHPELREECAHQLARWTQYTKQLLTAAKKRHAPGAAFQPEAVAWFLNSLWQGSMLIGKTRGTPEMIRANLKLARDYLDLLFQSPAKT